MSARHPSTTIPARPTYKYSLDSLKIQSKDTEAAEAGTAEAWSLLESFEAKASSSTTHLLPTSKATKIDADLVAYVQDAHAFRSVELMAGGRNEMHGNLA